MLEVLCVGLGRTGTASLAVALGQLGFAPCYQMADVINDPRRIAQWTEAARGDPVDWEEVFAGFRSAVFWPAAPFWPEIAGHYGDVRMILTVRDPGQWYDSARNTIFRTATMPDSRLGRWLLATSALTRPGLRDMRRMMRAAVWEPVFGGTLADRQRVIAAYQRHAEAVRRLVPPERLLEYEVTSGWEPLCRFLGVPPPDLPFPEVNDGAAFRRTQARQIAMGLGVPVVTAAAVAALIRRLLRSGSHGAAPRRWRRPAGGQGRDAAGPRFPRAG